MLSDPWTVHDDARQVVYQARLATRDATMAADPNGHQAELYVPALLAGAYHLVGHWIDPLTFTKLLPLALSPLLSLLVFLPTRRRFGAGAGLCSSGLVMLHSWSRWPPQWGAGDAGEFLGVLEAAALASLDCGHPLAAAALTVLAAHLYPPAFLILGGASAAVAAWQLRPRRTPTAGSGSTRGSSWRMPRPTAPVVVLAAGILMGAGVVGLRSHQLRHGEAGRLFTLAEARSMVEFSPRGRSPLFFEDTWRSLSNDRSGLALDPPTLGLLAIALAAVAAAGRRRVAPSPAAIAMALAGVTLWAVARYLVFLYQPVRFVVVTLPLVAALAGGANLALAVGRIPGRAGRASAWAAVTLGMVIAFAPRIYASHVTASPPALFAALRGTPADALVAGPPLMLDFVPAFAERRVLVSDEMMPPMFVRRYQTVRGLMAAMLTAYTASEPEEVDRFCREHGVTHWIVDGDDFDPRATWSYFPPFDEIVVTARRRGPPFALAEAARGRELPGAAPYAIVPCPLPAAPTRGAPASQPPS